MAALLCLGRTAGGRLLGGATVRSLSTAHGSVLAEGSGVVAYGRVQAEAVGPALEQLVGQLEADFRQFERDVEAGPVTWEGTVERAERLRWPLERAWGAVGHLNGVRNSEELRTQYQALQPKVVALFTQMGQSKPLYGALCRLAEGTDLDAAQRRIIDSALQEARLAGVGLEGAPRQRFNDVAVALSAASTKFSNNVLDATKAYEELVQDPVVVAGLPDAVLALMADRARQKGHAAATAHDGPWLLTLDHPCFGPFMQYSTHRPTRERLYRSYITRASSLEAGARHSNEGLMGEILGLRREQSALLGYQSYAAMSLTRKMAKEVGAVEALLAELHTHCLPAATRDMQQLHSYAQHHGHEGPLMHWDTAYWSERQKKEVYGVDGEQLRPYFPLSHVLDGLFGLARSLFGVSIKEAGLEEGVVWHADVRYYEVCDAATGQQLAGFFLDPYSRPQEKRGGAWMDVCLNRSKVMAPPGHKARLPIAHLVCNQMPPVDGRPSLMTFYEVQTLFHEFGHGLQHMLTSVDHSDAAGINGVEWDAVELPSQFMENWCYDRDTVAAISGHVDTGRPLPSDIFERLLGARTYMAGSGMLRQLQFAAVDLALHHSLLPGQDPLALYQQLAPSYSVLPPLAEDRFLCGFSHIFAGGYAAGYYSYKWAEVLSQDAFGAFEEAGPAQYPALGRRFRETVLGLGGSRHPAQVFEAFRGRQPSTEPLLRTYGLLQANA